MDEMRRRFGLYTVIGRLDVAAGSTDPEEFLRALKGLLARIRASDVRLTSARLWDLGLIRRSDHTEVRCYFWWPGESIPMERAVTTLGDVATSFWSVGGVGS
ncbi:MAG: hypothetical protein R6U92_07595 [Bacillota bacterium]